MRKLILQMHITIDGYVAGANGQLDWMIKEADPIQVNFLSTLTARMDTILMGRKMAVEFTNYWEDVVKNQPQSPEIVYARKFVDTRKIVFSKTMKSFPGKNVTVENDDLVTAVRKLKSGDGKDMIVYGGARFVSQLLKYKLVDDLYLLVNPVTIGEGLGIFSREYRFELVQSVPCGNGILINQYTQLTN